MRPQSPVKIEVHVLSHLTVIMSFGVLISLSSHAAEGPTMSRRAFLLCSVASAASVATPASLVKMKPNNLVNLRDFELFWTGNPMEELDGLYRHPPELFEALKRISEKPMTSEARLFDKQSDHPRLANVRKLLLELIHQRSHGQTTEELCLTFDETGALYPANTCAEDLLTPPELPD